MVDRNHIPRSKEVRGITLTLYIDDEDNIVPACVIGDELIILNEKGIFVIKWLEENRDQFLSHMSKELGLEKPLNRLRFYVDSYH